MDYPDYAAQVAEAVADQKVERGVLVCGTGIGMAITANKVPGVRAALCSDLYTARMSREHNDANVLALGGRLMGPEMALDILKMWLETEFAGDRHRRRSTRSPTSSAVTRRPSATPGHMGRLERVDPEIAKAIRAETERQSRNLELIASENFVSEAVLEAVGLGPHQQVRRGLPGPALLRRLRDRRRRRGAGHRARQGALRRRARQRPAALGLPGQHGGVLHAPQARRHRARR